MKPIILKQKYRIIETFLSKNGSYGVVSKAINIETNQIVAVKEIRQPVTRQGLHPTVVRQKSILQSFEDNHIVRLKDYFIQQDQQNTKKIYLIFPFYQMNLAQFIRQQYKDGIPRIIVKKMMKQLLSALKTAHIFRFMHRDIKMANILVDYNKQDPQNFTLKLADWGESRKFNVSQGQNFTDKVTPPVYRSPELIFGTKKYTQSVDIWSMGCLFYELLFANRLINFDPNSLSSNQFLFEIQRRIGLADVDDEKWIVQKYAQKNLQINEDDLKQFRLNSLDIVYLVNFNAVDDSCDLLKVNNFLFQKMLRINPRKRISALDALKHSYFDFNN